MKMFLIAGLSLCCLVTTAQTKNFIDQPYLETMAKADTLVHPDRIYLNIQINEIDTKNKISVEEQERRMAGLLESLEIDLKEQLTLSDLASNFKSYFLKGKKVVKAKGYQLVVYDAVKAGEVLVGLESVGISNVRLDRTEYSEIEALQLQLKSRAALKARQQAQALLQPLGHQVGGVLHLSDRYSQIQPRYFRSDEVVVVGYAADAKAAPVDINFEKIKVEAEINVKFKID